MRPTPSASAVMPLRWGGVDALRGLAMVWMTVYHLCFDLNHFGYIHQNFYTDPFWTWQRTAIVSLFLLCAGMGQAIAVEQTLPWRRFWRRWAQVAGCALLVTAGSYWMYPKSFIYFGVLHGMAAMLLLARLSAGWGAWLWPAGGLAVATPLIAKYVLLTGAGAEFSSYFNAPWLNWLGWITVKPVTEDYVPVFPWLGVMWWGVALGQWRARHRGRVAAPTLPAALGPLAWLGRWSLSYYMLHQPVLIGLLMALAALK